MRFTPPQPSRDQRLLGLALAKGWISAAQALLDTGQLLRERVISAAQLESLQRELDRGQAYLGEGPPEDEAPTALARSDGSHPSMTPSGGGSSIFSASWIKTWAHFEDLVLLAEGGMGRIFKAKDTRLRRKVALKMLRREDPELQLRFLREAELQARVNHPNVCRIYEAGEWRGQAFIAMELIEGDTFKVAAKTMDLRQKLALMVQACEGVHAAHREGLIHRDLKPTNLMVAEEEDGRQRAVVLDFGLARPAQSTGLTQSGVVMGTVHYMSPEQARGQDRKIDRRTDVYALGVTVYEIFAEHPPFHSEHGLEAISKILAEDPPPLARAADVPRDLDTVVMKCLEKEPNQRYDSARALGDELQRVLDGDPILARRAPWPERAMRWARKNRALVAVGAVGLIAAVVFGTVAVRERLRARQRAEFAQRFGQEAERIEALIRYVRLMPRHDATADLNAVETRVGYLEDRVRVGDALESLPARFALGRAYLALGRVEAARERLEEAWAQGFRGPDAAYALGKALGQVYLLEVERSERLPEPQLRAARKAELEQELLGRAKQLLREGRASSLEPSAFQEGLLAFYEGREGEALNLVKETEKKAGWLFEAKVLEGDLLVQQARREERAESALSLLISAASIYQEAQRLAPSDPGPCLREARSWRQALARVWQIGRPGEEAFAGCLKACDAAMRIQPDSPDAQILRAWAGAERGRELLEKGDFVGAKKELNDAVMRAQAVLNQQPKQVEPKLVSAFGHLYIGVANQQAGQNAEEEFETGYKEALNVFEADPSESLARYLAGLASTRKMILEIATGRAPWKSFEAGLAIALDGIKRQPSVAFHVYTAGILFVERAEYERTHGLDPRESTRAAESFLMQAISMAPSDFAAHYSLGNAYLIRGQYESARELAGEESLRQALKAYSKARELNPRHYIPLATSAEAALWLAQRRYLVGEDPTPWLVELRKYIDLARRRNPSYPKTAVIEARGVALEALVSAKSAQTMLTKIFAKLDAIPKNQLDSELGLAIAELALVWPEPEPRFKGAVATGIKAARIARQRNPLSGESWLLEGALLLRQGSRAESDAYFQKALLLDGNLTERARRLGWTIKDEKRARD